MPALTAVRPRPGFPRMAFPILDFTSPGVMRLDAPDPGTGEALEEAEVLEIASRLLDAQTEAERDHLLGATMTHAAKRSGAVLPAPLGAALGGLLKYTARYDLNGAMPGQRLGFELEGLETYEQEFEATARFVRLAGEAARHAAEEGLIAQPRQAALAALASAADIYAPALLPALMPRPASLEVWAHGSQEIGAYGRPPEFTATPGPIALRFENFEYDPGMEYFLGGLVRSVGRAAGSVARFAAKAADTVGKIPILGDVARAGIGAVRLGMGPMAIAIDAGSRLARGQSLGAALKGAVGGQVGAVRDQLKLAEMVAPFVPGIGTGVAAALGAANALASGRPITEAVFAAARGALPGGAIAQAAFDTALNLAKGKSITEALLATARDRLPGGPAAKAAFDGAVALAQGKRLQDVAFAAAGRILPPSPYAADALSFVKRVANGQNIQNAALSTLGQRALRQVRSQASLASNTLAGSAMTRATANLPRNVPLAKLPFR